MTDTNQNEPTNMTESNVNNQPMSYADTLRETQQTEFPLLSEVTQGLVDNPLTLMNAHTDINGVMVPCALPDAMVEQLPEMMSEPLSLYEDPDIRTMLLAAMMPTLGSAMSNVRVRHERKLYAPGMMNVCIGPSASGKGAVGDVASLVDGINDAVISESEQEMADYSKKRARFDRLGKQLDRAAKSNATQLIDINDISQEIDEPVKPMRRMHKLPSKSTAANYHCLLYANGNNISYLYVPELAEMNAGNNTAYGDFKYILLAAQNEEPLHTGRKTDDEDYLIRHTRLSLVATGTESSVHAFIPNLEDGLSTRFIYHNLPAKDTVRDEMDEAMAEAMNDVYTHHRDQLTAIWRELRQFDGKPCDELPRLLLSDAQREMINEFYRQLVSFIALTQPDRDLRAPILRTRLNLYRMLMIIAVLRRHEEMGTAEGMFADKVFTTTDADLRWGLAYIFYLMMQTSAIYNRLRHEEKEQPKQTSNISSLGFMQMLPQSFTTAVANKAGEELGIGVRTVGHHLRVLCTKGYIERLRQGSYRKLIKRVSKKLPQAA